MNHKLESRLLGEISTTSDMQMIPLLMSESEEELNSFLMPLKKEREKTGLKHNIKKSKIIASGPITSRQIDGEKVETVADFIFLGSKITEDSDCSYEIKRCLLRVQLHEVMGKLPIIIKIGNILIISSIRVLVKQIML